MTLTSSRKDGTVHNVRQIVLPYGFDIGKDGLAVRVFNREYGSLARFSLKRRLMPSQIKTLACPNTSFEGEDGTRRETDGRVTCIWFYNDGCTPFLGHEGNDRAYWRRIERFAKLESAVDPPPRPHRHEGTPA